MKRGMEPFLVLNRTISSKSAGLLTQIWVKYGQTQMLGNFHFQLFKFFNYIFNPTFGFVHI